jgi:hypothetical protein
MTVDLAMRVLNHLLGILAPANAVARADVVFRYVVTRRRAEPASRRFGALLYGYEQRQRK